MTATMGLITNRQVMERSKVAPASIELMVIRLLLWQTMVQEPTQHAQCVAVISPEPAFAVFIRISADLTQLETFRSLISRNLPV